MGNIGRMKRNCFSFLKHLFDQIDYSEEIFTFSMVNL